MNYKQLITDNVLAAKSRKQTAIDMKIPPKLLDQLIVKIWPNTRGKWTALRETLGLSPWGAYDEPQSKRARIPVRSGPPMQILSAGTVAWSAYPFE